MEWDDLRTGKPNRMCMNQAKQHQTRATGSTAPDTTTGTPLQQGDTLVAYENGKRTVEGTEMVEE